MENTELSISQQNLYISPIVGMEEAKAKFEQVREFTAKCLTKGTDYGSFAGVSKPSLLKPGAEKISTLFGLTPKFACTDRIMNWNGEGNPDNEPFFYFEYKCELYKGGEYVSSCIGSCNSWEKKYRYRKGELICPNCGKPLRKDKNGNGFYCWTKQGGCGATFTSNDPRVANQKVGDVKNFDTAEQVNTFQKMAQKRAFIGAVLIACNLSEYYTQDIEDMASFAVSEDVPPMVEGDYVPIQEVPQPAQQQKQQKQKKPFDEIEFLNGWNEKASVVIGDQNITLPDITLEMAADIDTTNSDGTVEKMGNRSVGQLAGMWKAYKKRLEEPTANKEDVLMRLSAVNKILTTKKKAQEQLNAIS